MTTYQAPVGEYKFLAGHVLAREYQAYVGEEGSADTLGTVLEALGQFVSERLVPLMAAADRTGCRVTAEGVEAPAGYHEVYKDFVADGWAALHTAIEDGGQGLPLPFGFACDELLSAGSMSFALYASIRLGVYSVLKTLGSPYLQETYLRKIGSGEWNGTMCLTEPQCGTDLSLIRTTATDAGNGTYRLSGTKIFITGGDHDLTPNIVHLVLARIHGAPSGLAGLGLFIVPKFSVGADGSPEARNGVTCPRVEEKLGIHASATAELLFDNAEGWIVGAPGTGLMGMFSMMKLARIGTAFQAVGVAEIASQNAIAYALERIQGRDLVEAGTASIAIAGHPNIRREIVRMRTQTSSARMLAFMASLVNEQALGPREADSTKLAQVILPVLMSTAKAISSEIGVDVATAAMQTHGGHGYIRDTGIEVLLRDVQILPIYEGTNDVQSLDLILRRLDDGRHQAVSATLEWLRNQIAGLGDSEAHGGYVKRTLSLLSRIDDVVSVLKEELQRSPFAALQCAREFLWLVGHGVMATLWLRVLFALDGNDLPVDRIAKHAQVRFYFSYLLPETEVRISRLMASIEIEQSLRTYPVNLNF